MIDTIIVAKNNHYGLTRDARLLASALGEVGVKAQVAGIHDRPLRDRLSGLKRARRIIHLERVFPQWIDAGEENLLVPNQERFPRRHIRRLRKIDLVLAKTQEARAVFAGQDVATEYLGFTSEDRFESSVVKDWNRVLHLAGGSTLKGTEDVVALWQRHPEWPELVLVHKRPDRSWKLPPNVSLITGYADDGPLRTLQNQCGIHLCPSRSEGWGHNLVEGLSCGALVIATDAAPMNEHVHADYGILVDSTRNKPRHLGTCHFVTVDGLEAAVNAAFALPVARKIEMGRLARARFLEIDHAFRARVKALLARERPMAGTAPGLQGLTRSVAPGASAHATGAIGQSVKASIVPGLNRPVLRYAARFYCLLRYGTARAHAEDWWPDLVLSLPDGAPGKIVYRDRVIAPLLPYPAALDGSGDLIVVGSGPSLGAQAVNRIPIGQAYLLNGAIHLLAESAARPFGVVIEDERFVWRYWPTIAGLVQPQTHCYLSTSVIRALCQTIPEWLAVQHVHHLDFVHRPYGARRPQLAAMRKLPFLRWAERGSAAISLAPQSGLMPAGSVAVTGAQLALSLAPARLGLAGIDLTGTAKPRFYETVNNRAMSRLEAATDGILAAFRIIGDEGKRRGIAVENYSPVSRLAEAGIRYVPRLES